MSKLPLTVIIHTRNSEATLKLALESVSKLASEIIVMDMKSTDKTKEIAKQFQTVFLQASSDFHFVEPARNEALAKATQPWIFILDADEEVTPELRDSIQKIVEDKSPDSADCFFIPRVNEIFQKKLEDTGWWPDYQMRLFKKGTVTWENQIHAVPKIAGKVEHLPAERAAAIFHHNFQKIDQFIDRMNRYTSIEAQQLLEKLPTSHFTSAVIFHSFSDEFLRRLFQKNGIDEGVHGLALSLLQSIYQVLTPLKIWEATGFIESKEDQRQLLREISEFQAQLNYWKADWQVKHSTGFSKLFWKWKRKLKK